MWDTLVARLIHWVEGGASILALRGKSWPRLMAGGRFGMHVGKEHLVALKWGGQVRVVERTAHTPRLRDP